MQISNLVSNLNAQVAQTPENMGGGGGNLSSQKFKNARELEAALYAKYDFLPSTVSGGKDFSVQISPKLLQKALRDPETMKWLDDNLAEYQSFSIPYLTRNSMMTHHITFFNDKGDISSIGWGPAKEGDGPGLSPREELEKLLEKLKIRREEKAKEEARLEEIREEKAAREALLDGGEEGEIIETRGATSKSAAEDFASKFADLAAQNALLNLKI